MLTHCAGMPDLVALPVWVGTVVSRYAFDPQQAGGAATPFLVGASVASICFAPRFRCFIARWAAVAGFALATLAFLVCAAQTAFPVLAVLHFAGGLAAGTALSFTHGTIGHATNPHCAFAWAGLAIGIFCIVFLGSASHLVQRFGGAALFIAFAAVMGPAAPGGAASPSAADAAGGPTRRTGAEAAAARGAVWFAIVAMALLAMLQAMTLSFCERMGTARGFGIELVTLALVAYGVVTLFPAPLAALLEKRIRPRP